MSSLYIPPKEVPVRIVGLSSSRALFSRHHRSPYFWHHPFGEEFADQWWYIVPGSGSHQGKYLIKSKHTQEVIFSRTHMKPNVGTIDSDGKYEDNWFVLEPGTGQRINNFRLVCPYSDTILFSRTHQDPQVDNWGSGNTKYDDQYFRLFFENMVFKGIKFNVDEGKILDTTPIMLARSNLSNNSSVDQKISSTFKEATENESSFEYTLGFAVEVGTSFSCGVPLLAEGKIEVSATVSNEFKWGSTTKKVTEFSATFEATAPPHSTVVASATVTRSVMQVPFTMTWTSPEHGYEVKTEGAYRGVQFYDLKCDYTEPRSS
ncbi:hypothetical protein SLS55_008293 [Diplodia seriata]|uniref:Uncharacterized protein n=1 Tax=Diplodia seriata TaxID=420778 RepID=A0ABR3CA23_9PEZI